jgi:hypothetical protein
MKVRDQEKALAMIDGDDELRALRHLRAPYLDLEVGACLQASSRRFFSPSPVIIC